MCKVLKIGMYRLKQNFEDHQKINGLLKVACKAPNEHGGLRVFYNAD